MATRNIKVKMQQRNDTAANWESKNPILAVGEFGYDTTNGKLKIGDGETAWNSLPTIITTRFLFATASWSDIAQIAAAGNAKKYFKVGDEKTIELSTGESVTFVILGFNHDDLTAGGKAPITIGMKNLLSTNYPMNATNVNTRGWNGSAMRTQTMATLLSQLPADLKAIIKPVNKKATAGGVSTEIVTSSDKLFLLSAIELTGNTVAPANAAGYINEGEQYEYYKTVVDAAGDAKARIKYSANGGGSAYNWWLRSPSVTSATNFRFVSSSGSVNNGNSASHAFGVSFGFCV